MPQPSQLTFSIFVICMYVYIGFNFGQRIFVLQRYLSLALAGFVVPLFVGREKSIKALQEAMKTDKSIILVAQKNSETDDPAEKDLFSFDRNGK